MTLATLALICALGLLGPLMSLRRQWRIPVVLGELIAGGVFGSGGFGVLHPHDSTFTLLADAGFVLVMFVAGSHVPVRDAELRGALTAGARSAALVGLLATIVAVGLASVFGTGHAPLYAVVLASSSAALVLPITDALQLRDRPALQLLAQVAIADTVSIVALPLAVDPARAGRAALGVLAVIAAAAASFPVLSWVSRSGLRRRLHHVSEQRKFALELRINLTLLFALAALAVWTQVSIMLAGFSFGLVTAAVGEPRRLSRQVFALADGFLGPLFFIWLGASIQLGDLLRHPAYIGLGLALGLGALVVHAVTRLVGAPLPLALLAASQLGVPVAAATLGTQRHLLHPGEAAALLLGAIVTLAATTLASRSLGPGQSKGEDADRQGEPPEARPSG